MHIKEDISKEVLIKWNKRSIQKMQYRLFQAALTHRTKSVQMNETTKNNVCKKIHPLRCVS